MQYTDYINSYNARREREQQLANQYNQKPEGLRVKNLWMVSVERHKSHEITGKDVLWTIVGLFICAGILVLSIVV